MSTYRYVNVAGKYANHWLCVRDDDMIVASDKNLLKLLGRDTRQYDNKPGSPLSAKLPRIP